jgi:cytochrome c-type biogenesis protein CcmH
MTTFIFIAIALTLVAIAIIVVPLLRAKTTAASPAIWAAFGAAGVLVFGAGGLYLTWSNWSWSAAAEADAAVTPENMVSRLARRLEKNPNDLDGWMRLGRSYSVMEQYPLSVRAYQRANEIAGGKNAEALLGMGEALVLGDENELSGRGGKLIEQAIALEPQNGRALFYGAAAALRRNELPLARQRFVDMLALNPPDNVRPILEQQIGLIDQKLGQDGQSGETSPSTGPAAGQGAGQGRGPAVAAVPGSSGSNPQQAANESATGAVPPVRVRVTLAAKLNGNELSSSPLFVLVRDPRQAGPPLAVKRLRATFPQTVELTTADSMLPTHTFRKGQLVEVVARVSKSGSPTQSAGDPFGLAAHTVGEGGVVDIQIEHVSP